MRHFKIARDTETGRKFTALDKRLSDCHEKSVDLLEEMWGDGLEITNYRLPDNSVSGGIGSVFMDGFVPYYMKRVKKTRTEYLPSKRTVQGKLLNKKIEQLPMVTINDLNACIGIPENSLVGSIGYNSTNDQYALVLVHKNWILDIPTDCEEIDSEEYSSLKRNSEHEVIEVK